MARKRRQFEVFSMSFLDCMSCGFGAVILFFMIINAQVRETTEDDPSNLMAETRKLEIEILDGRKDLVLAKNTMEQLDTERNTAEGQIAQIIALIQQLQAELAQYDNDTLAKVERVEQLESDIKSLEEEVKRLLAMAAEQQAQGNRQREFQGDGDRQYLTGLKLRGRHTLILVDRSASMLDDTIVNVIRRRNMSIEDKLAAVKWRQVVASVDWLTTQFEPGSEFQIYMFNTEAVPVIKGTEGVWLKADDITQINEAIRVLRITPPENGTNMKAAYEVAAMLSPRPDNIILLVDGLPTMDGPTAGRNTISGQERFNLHFRAIRELPSGIPVNVFLYPMEGDYEAPILYWQLAFQSRGSMISVSRDWP
ncbi:MAG: VWA domain-containing protein [Gammaproteobacteria bacterium]|nr:VWA domain-containing protein [Gammaproteobacteria bacterium]MDH5302529.1 VWA domain-containing protein [Gammaproteobacteria bacterium]MDH5321923.1 VWA domain-containing protein [Gammaproteobacteria bacterium]